MNDPAQTQQPQRPASRLPEDQETEEELERTRPVPLNLRKSAFDGAADHVCGGINTGASVFDRQSIFHTS